MASFVRVFLLGSLVCLLASALPAQDAHAGIANAQPQLTNVAPHVNGAGATAVTFDSIPFFRGSFTTPGLDTSGASHTTWTYTMAGTPPQQGGSTIIDDAVIPISLELLDYDGSVRFRYDVTPFVGPALLSPVFQNAEYTSSLVPTQFPDAVQRAEFYYPAKPDWHTLLRPSLKRGRTLRVPRGFYNAAFRDDGSCCKYVLIEINEFEDLMFPAKQNDPASLIGAAEADGDMTPHTITSFLLPNTFLYLNGKVEDCCVLGYHTYDQEPGENGAPQQRYVLNVASWVSPGLFEEFEDVTALSHEMSETLNDPFVDNMTPWWKSPNGRCQDNLEVGDVIEGMSMATYPMAMNGMTYHPQNEALLPWFEWQSPSAALGGAYSYPNQNTITQLSAAENKNCK